MKIKINGKEYEYLNNVSNVEKVIGIINQELEENNQKLAHLVIDGNPVYEDFTQYFIKNIQIINVVEVITQSLQSLIVEILVSAEEYTNNVAKRLSSLAESFYQNPKADHWNDLSLFFEGIEWLIGTTESIDSIKNLEPLIRNYEMWNRYTHNIKNIQTYMPDLEQAIINQDYVLIGDLLLYEILPILEEIKEIIGFLLPIKGDSYVS